MTVTVEFRCPECGLLTPGLADLDELPPDVDPRRKVPLHHKCHHCDAPLMRTMRAGELLALARDQ